MRIPIHSVRGKPNNVGKYSCWERTIGVNVNTDSAIISAQQIIHIVFLLGIPPYNEESDRVCKLN